MIVSPVDPLRCASVLKPVYAWVTPEADPRDVAAAVVRSDNTATDRVVAAAGGLTALRRRVEHRTGVVLGDAATWGRLMVSDRDVVACYDALRSGADGMRVIELMRATPPVHRFGCDVIVAEASGVELRLVAVKSGWDLSDDEEFARTRIVLLTHDVTVAATVCTPVDAGMHARWRRVLDEGGPEALLPVHDQWAGCELRTSVTRMLDQPSPPLVHG